MAKEERNHVARYILRKGNNHKQLYIKTCDQKEWLYIETTSETFKSQLDINILL